jgi:hypothetical protein
VSSSIWISIGFTTTVQEKFKTTKAAFEKEVEEVGALVHVLYYSTHLLYSKINKYLPEDDTTSTTDLNNSKKKVIPIHGDVSSSHYSISVENCAYANSNKTTCE